MISSTKTNYYCQNVYLDTKHSFRAYMAEPLMHFRAAQIRFSFYFLHERAPGVSFSKFQSMSLFLQRKSPVWRRWCIDARGTWSLKISASKIRLRCSRRLTSPSLESWWRLVMSPWGEYKWRVWMSFSVCSSCCYFLNNSFWKNGLLSNVNTCAFVTFVTIEINKVNQMSIVHISSDFQFQTYFLRLKLMWNGSFVVFSSDVKKQSITCFLSASAMVPQL